MRAAPQALVLATLALSCGAPVERVEPQAIPVVAQPAPEPAPPPAPPTETETEAPSSSACATDDDCHFDDPCVPQACTATAPPDLACAESRPPPGSCVCVAERCVMRRDMPEGYLLSEETCVHGFGGPPCGISLAEGTCAPGGEHRAHGGHDEARPVCGCHGAPPDARCRLEWHEPPTCETERDCWFDDDGPVLRPIRRPRRLRRHRFEPCVDGEVAPACVGGFCTRAPVAFGC